jgi:hypothetical protein
MKKDTVYRVRFREKEQGGATEALVKQVEPSEIPGLVCLSQFVFKDQKKAIILPEEEAASKRFHKTQSIHIPYHNILFIEETIDEPTDVKHLPFLKEVQSDQEDTDDHDSD